jgi:hypothetical protein
MPKANTNANSRSIRHIAIDWHFIDDVRTRLHSDAGSKSLSYLSAPVERYHATEDGVDIGILWPEFQQFLTKIDGLTTNSL